jgi:2-C-methyl-D-erythritol 2,4-cyclodiphosphate synthase
MELWRRLTNRAKRVVVNAHNEAARQRTHLIGTDHLLWGMLTLGEGVGWQVLYILAGDLDTLRIELEEGMEIEGETEVSGDASFTAEAREILSAALDEAKQMHLPFIGTEHLLLGLLRVESGRTSQLLRLHRVQLDRAREYARRLREVEVNRRKEMIGKLEPIELPAKGTRTGIGYDAHRLVEGRKLVLGGVEIEGEKGLLGHSDGDVVLHATADAVLGACGLGDIGMHFPDTDERYKDADSRALLQVVAEMARANGWEPVNVDVSILAEAPKIGPYRDAMRKAIAEAMGIAEACVNVKATTNEGMGFVGLGEGIAAMAVASVAEATKAYGGAQIARPQGVEPLKVNEAAQPVHLPGEEFVVAIMKEGKEPRQGVGYLADGTMVVVEGAARYLGESVRVAVTSTLQTSAGEMIFAVMVAGRGEHSGGG